MPTNTLGTPISALGGLIHVMITYDLIMAEDELPRSNVLTYSIYTY
jgi:hypothetical protein